jgi:hypothetical protein
VAATSNAFTVAPGAAASLVVTSAPASADAGAGFAVTVTARDASGNTAAGFNGNVTLAIANNPSGGVLSGTATVAAVNGVATFTGLSIDKAGVGYTLSASATGLTSGTSAAITIAGSNAVSLSFTTQPPEITTAGTAFTVVVTALDGSGAPTAYTGDVTISIADGTPEEFIDVGQLFGTKTVAAVNGVATFSDLRIDKLGVNYKLTAASPGLTSATSSAFTVTASPAAVLEFLQPIGNQVAGQPFPAALVAKDTLGNFATSYTGNVTIAIGNNPAGATLGGTLTVAATGGVGIFTDLTLDLAGTGYTLTASAEGLAGATSSAFNVDESTGAAFHVVAPATVTAGQGFTLTATVKNDAGQIVTSFNGPVIVGIDYAPPEGSQATLSGVTEVTAVNGVATFTGLSINKAGAGYVLMVYGPESSYSQGYTDPMTVVAGDATSMEFSTQPKNVRPDEKFTVVVRALDAGGNVATSFNKQVTIGFDHNPGDASLSGTQSVTAQNGVATFAALSIDREGSGYSLKAISELGQVDSKEFNVIPPGEARILFWADENSGYNVVPDAVAEAGQTLTIATDFDDFVRLLTENSWDLVIFGEQGFSQVSGTLKELLTQYVGGGGRLLAATWVDEDLLPLMQAVLTDINYTAFTASEHSIFAGINSPVQLFNPGWGTFSQGYKPVEESGAQCLGNTPSESCMAILGNNNLTLLLGPLFDTYCMPDPEAEEPTCSAPDGVRLVANSVTYLLSQSPPAGMRASTRIARPSRRPPTTPQTQPAQRNAGTTRPSNCKSPRCGAR